MVLEINDIIYQPDIEKLKLTERVCYRIDKSRDNQNMYMLKSTDDDEDVITYVESLSNWILYSDKFESLCFFIIESMKSNKNVREMMKQRKVFGPTDEMGTEATKWAIDTHPDLFI